MKCLRIIVVLFLAGSSLSLSAHQLKEAVTKVVFNELSEFIEVTHRFSLHDAEHSARQLFGVTMDMFKNPMSQRHFADYVAGSFKLAKLDGTELALSFIGHEIDGRYIWIYQELPIDMALEGLQVELPALTEIWPDQTNLVNIEKAGEVYSKVFTSGTGEQKIPFTKKP